MLCCY